jgi:hypothetical protein
MCVAHIEFVRVCMKRWREKHDTLQARAVAKLQSNFRRFLKVRQWPVLRQHLLEVQENQRMMKNEFETRAFLAKQAKVLLDHNASSPTAKRLQLLLSAFDSDGDESAPHSSVKPVKTDVLVETYRKLHRIFAEAWIQAASACTEEYQRDSKITCMLFDQLDHRHDNLIDRYEFRLGVRKCGVRMDRRLTRAYVLFPFQLSW